MRRRTRRNGSGTKAMFQCTTTTTIATTTTILLLLPLLINTMLVGTYKYTWQVCSLLSPTSHLLAIVVYVRVPVDKKGRRSKFAPRLHTPFFGVFPKSVSSGLCTDNSNLALHLRYTRREKIYNDYFSKKKQSPSYFYTVASQSQPFSPLASFSSTCARTWVDFSYLLLRISRN